MTRKTISQLRVLLSKKLQEEGPWWFSDPVNFVSLLVIFHPSSSYKNIFKDYISAFENTTVQKEHILATTQF